MRDKYTDSIRIGIVSSINEKKGTAKVVFPDRQGIVSMELPVGQQNTFGDRDYCMPDIHEPVRVFMDPEAPHRGYIQGSYYDDTRLPPIGNANKRYTLFKDNTLIEYDRELHTLTINVPEEGDTSIFVTTASDINVLSAKNINITAGENLTINVDGDTTIHTTGTTNIASDDAINISAQQPIHITSGQVVQIQGAKTTLVVP